MDDSPLDLLAGTGFARPAALVDAVAVPAYKMPVPVIRLAPCRYCGAPVLHVIEDRGNAIMVQEEPRGTYVVDGVSALNRPLVRLVSAGYVLRVARDGIRKLKPREPRYAPHFLHCTKQDAWSRRFTPDPWAREAFAETE